MMSAGFGAHQGHDVEAFSSGIKYILRVGESIAEGLMPVPSRARPTKELRTIEIVI